MESRCELCGREAVYRDSVPDVNGVVRHGEFAYRSQLLCLVHGMDRKTVATARVEALTDLALPAARYW